jgi:hypothetical protein
MFGAAPVPLFAAVTPEALARRCPGVQMPKRVVVDSKVLQLAAVGVRLAAPFRLDVYAAGLYLERRMSQATRSWPRTR